MPYLVKTPFNQFGLEAVGNQVLPDNAVTEWPEGTVQRRIENGFLEVITEGRALDIEIENGTADPKKVKAREAANKAAEDARKKAEQDKIDAAIEAERVAAEKAKKEADDAEFKKLEAEEAEKKRLADLQKNGGK